VNGDQGYEMKGD